MFRTLHDMPPVRTSATTQTSSGGPQERDRSALYVGELLHDLVAAHLVDVHAADMPTVPAVAPALDDPVPDSEGLLGLEPRGGILEDRLPGVTDGSKPDVANPIGCRARAVEDALLREQRQGRFEVVIGPALPKSLDKLYAFIGLGYLGSPKPRCPVCLATPPPLVEARSATTKPYLLSG